MHHTIMYVSLCCCPSYFAIMPYPASSCFHALHKFAIITSSHPQETCTYRDPTTAATICLAPGPDHFVVILRYLPIGGLKEFNQVSVKLAYGDNSQAIQDARVAAVQSLSGTGSCRLMAEFMQRWMPGSKVYYLHLLLWGTHGGGGDHGRN